MANDVFANGREIACKEADGKSICAFPDVCMTPPENPATPPGVPVPYPNTGVAKNTTSGARTVKISGKEIMLKNKSYFKKSMGDEAGAGAKKGVVTSVNRGKVYFISWSANVKFEAENVVRHIDGTTHNHGSTPPGTLPTAHASKASSSIRPSPEECAEVRAEILKKYSKLGKELRKYDPVADSKGGFPQKWGSGVTVPCGHYKEIRDLQRGLRNDLGKYYGTGRFARTGATYCGDTGVRISGNVHRMTNRPIPRPPGC